MKPFAVPGLILWTATAALAQSDSYFCAGPNYIAYQFAMTGNVRNHTFFIVPLAADLTPPVSMPLPEFQTHGMRCEAREVRMLGWDQIFTIDVSDPARPKVKSATPLARPGDTPDDLKDGFGNLGPWNRNVRSMGQHDDIPIESPDNRFSFSLQIRAFPVRNKPCARSIETQLVQIDKSNRKTRQMPILKGEFPVDCQ